MPGARTLTLITAGQSNIGNWAGASYSPTYAGQVDNLNIFDGGMYAAVDPVLGCDGFEGYWPMRLADKLIGAGRADRVILVPVAIGATTMAEWKPGGQYHQRLTVAFARCAAHQIPVSAVLWQLGEADGAAGTTQAAWAADFNAMLGAQQCRGNDAPWFVGGSTYGGSTVYPAIQAAQAAVVNGTTVLAGGNSDTIISASHRQTGSSHFTAFGADANATLWLNALASWLDANP